MKTEFNWLTRLEELNEKGNGYRPSDQEDLTTMAQGWPTCACGQLCKLLPKRGDTAVPEDNKLYNLGCRFYNLVCRCDWSSALDIFRQIEARSFKLLQEMGILKPQPQAAKAASTTRWGSMDARATQHLGSSQGMPVGN